jgi:4-hydroxythreonine-4-phosphate dehydrogenase
MSKIVNLAISSGEPAGIGPEICIVAALNFIRDHPFSSITIYGDPNLFDQPFVLPKQIQIEAIPLREKVEFGKLNSNNAAYVVEVLKASANATRMGRHDALVTAPVQKSVINDANIRFTGHTEFLAELDGAKQVVMMLCGRSQEHLLRVALATTHMPLSLVPQEIRFESLCQMMQVMHDDLKNRFAIHRPRIRVAGLNPHAGESGHLGREELEIISPAIRAMQDKGILVDGPYPADTMFNPKKLDEVDAFLAMYHDQGLAAFKFATFMTGVNVSLGLSFVRTSVDHGTALDIAGKGIAESSSMFEALSLAAELALNKKNASGA